MFGIKLWTRRVDFFRPEEEIVLRGMWFATHVIDSAMRQRIKFHLISGEKAFFDLGLVDLEVEREIFLETLAYTVSFATEELKAKIMEAHANHPESYDLAILYEVSICVAFDILLKLPTPEARVRSAFYDHIDPYHWHADEDCEDETLWDSNDKLIPEMLFVKRVRRFAKVGRPDVMTTNVLAYRAIGVSFLKQAFMKRKSLGRLKSETKRRRALWPIPVD